MTSVSLKVNQSARVCTKAILMFSQTARSEAFSFVMVLVSMLWSCVFIMAHKFSMGLKPILWPGQSGEQATAESFSHFITTLLMWQCAPSCMQVSKLSFSKSKYDCQNSQSHPPQETINSLLRGTKKTLHSRTVAEYFSLCCEARL